MEKSAIVALSLVAVLLGSAPASAFPAIMVLQPEFSDVQPVSGHGRHQHHETHQSHGRDDFYEDNSELGILFFWLATGRSFGQQQERVKANAGWCAERYRSYRPLDNSYQPPQGPRRQCVSPYIE